KGEEVQSDMLFCPIGSRSLKLVPVGSVIAYLVPIALGFEWIGISRALPLISTPSRSGFRTEWSPLRPSLVGSSGPSERRESSIFSTSTESRPRGLFQVTRSRHTRNSVSEYIERDQRLSILNK